MTITLEQKAAWAARLRSDEFVQIVGDLCDGAGGNGRCALGVLCEVLGQKCTEKMQQPYYDFLTAHDIDCDPIWDLNDVSKKTFGEIADWLDTIDLDHRVFHRSAPRPARETTAER